MLGKPGMKIRSCDRYDLTAVNIAEPLNFHPFVIMEHRSYGTIIPPIRHRL